MCQKVRIVARGKRSPQHARHEREVIVLHQHDRIVAVGFGRRPRRRSADSRADTAPSRCGGRPDGRAPGGRAATAPRWRSRSSSPAPLPRSARRGAASTRRRRCDDLDAAAAVRRLAIGRSAAVRDPDARAGAHDRLERGDEAARRMAHDDRTRRPQLMNAAARDSRATMTRSPLQ